MPIGGTHVVRAAVSEVVKAAARLQMEDAFRSRSMALIERVAEAASDDVLRDALAELSALDGLLQALGSMAPELAEGPDPLAAAMAHGVAVKRDLLEQAGGTCSTEEVAELLGISRQAVDKRRRKGTLLAVPSGTGAYLFPRCQFDGPSAVSGLDRLLPVLPMQNPWAQLGFLLRPAPELEGQTPLEALREQALDDVLELAGSFGDQGGHG